MPAEEYPKHYVSGEEFPALTKDKLRVYSMQFCPYALRARIMLEKLNVDYEVININLRDKPEWFLDKYTGGTVPVLQINDKVIPESLICAEYIDDVYAKNGNNIISTDPYQKAQQKLILEGYSKFVPKFYKSIGKEEGTREEYLKGLDDYEKMLKKSQYFAGNEMGYVDLMMWPWFERIGSWVEALPEERFPKLLQWISNMKKDPVLIKLATTPKILEKFIKGMMDKVPVYDGLS